MIRKQLIQEQLLANPAKYIIAIVGEPNAGKSTTLRKFYTNSMTKYPSLTPTVHWGKTYGEFSLYVDLSNFRLGILTNGDVINGLYEELSDQIARNCDVIICPCRPESPATFKAVAENAMIHKYQIVWVDLPTLTGQARENATTDLANRLANLF